MIHKISSTNDLNMNNLGHTGESLVGGALSCTTYFETTSIVATLVDASDGKCGGGGWCMGASTMDG